MTCLSNLCIRGNQASRVLLVDSGILDPLIRLLKSSIEKLNQLPLDDSLDTLHQPIPVHPPFPQIPLPLPLDQPLPQTLLDQPLNVPIPIDHPLNLPADQPLQQIPLNINEIPLNINQVDTTPLDRNYDPTHESNDLIVDMAYKIQDITLALKMIAYLSKYPELRSIMHSHPVSNVFHVVEAFTCSNDVFPEIRKWAITCMRNAFKRDPNDKRGIRRCGFLNCPKVESNYHEFSKCSRCRRVVYCSKDCQRNAWGPHRNWCLLDISKQTAQENSQDTLTDISRPLQDSSADISRPLQDTLTDISRPLQDTLTDISRPLQDTLTDISRPLQDSSAGPLQVTLTEISRDTQSFQNTINTQENEHVEMARQM
jgi:hypothetical protein